MPTQLNISQRDSTSPPLLLMQKSRKHSVHTRITTSTHEVEFIYGNHPSIHLSIYPPIPHP
jgi:hypothetical protein